MTPNEFVEELRKLNIKITDLQLEQLNTYYELLIEYNKVMNLTGITNKEEVYLKHFYDSLTIIKVIDLNKIDSLCDIGTGAGFPGLVLKIVFPHLKITLIDSLQKRLKFLDDVIKKLHLKDIKTIHSRIEEYGVKHRELFDIVTARAVAPLNILLEYSSPIVKTNGYFIPLKGKIDSEPNFKNACNLLSMTLESKEEFILPIEKSHRTILKFRKCAKTNKKYPRRFSEIKSNPL